MADKITRVVALHEQLIELYATAVDDEQAVTDYRDILTAFTSEVALSASKAFAELMGVPVDNLEMLTLTDEQYRKLEASNMLERYMGGKEDTDD